MTAAAWQLGSMCAFDLETTAADPLEARVVTACSAILDGSGVVAPALSTWLLDPGIEIPEEAAAIHGVTTAIARADGRPAVSALVEIAAELSAAWAAGMPVIGHNVSYDLTVMACEMARHDLAPFVVSGPVVDTMVIDKHIDRYRRGKRTLTRCCEVYQVSQAGAHDAQFDALAAARIAWRIAWRNKEIGSLSLPDLHAAQIGWATEQGASLQKHFRKTDPTAVVDGTWPVRAALVGAP